MRPMKIILWSVAGLIALVVLGIAAVLLLVDPNDYKGQIANAVKEKTGRELKLEGDLGLSFFPWLAIDLGRAELSDPPGFSMPAGTSATPFASIQKAAVGVRLLPLLRGQLEVGKVKLDGMQLNLKVDAQGHTNWEDLGQSSSESQAPASGPNPLQSIAGLTIENSGLDYVDAQEASRWRVRDMALKTGRLQPGKPMEVDFSCRLDSGENTLELPIALHTPALAFDLQQQTMSLPDLSLKVGAAQLSGVLTGQKIVDAPAFDGQLRLAEVSPRELFKQFAIETPQTSDPQVLQKLSFEGKLSATTERMEFSDLTMKLDDSTLRGRLGVADFEKTALRFDLQIDQLNLDRYLEPAAEPAAGTGSGAKAAEEEPVELPLDLLKTLNAQGTLDIAALTVAGVKMTAVQLKLDAADGQVRIDPTQANLYGGTHRGAVRIDARAAVAQVAIDEHLQGIDFAPLMLELFETKRLSGKGDAVAKLTARGNDSGALMKSLDGKVSFSMANGAVEGADLWYEIRRARALFRREAAPAITNAGRTAFHTLKATANIEDAVLDNRDLTIDIDYLKVTGGGTLNLISKDIDYKLQTSVYRMPSDRAPAGAATAVQTSAGSTGEAELKDLKEAEIPVRITGTLDALKIRPDFESRLKAEASKKIEEKKEDLKKKLGDQLQKWFGGKKQQ